MSAEDVDKVYRQFWALERLHQLGIIYYEIKPYLLSFMRLFKIMKQQGMGEQEMVNTMKFADKLTFFQTQVEEHPEEVRKLI